MLNLSLADRSGCHWLYQCLLRLRVAGESKTLAEPVPPSVRDVLRRSLVCIALLGTLLAARQAVGQAATGDRTEITSIVAHWANYAHEDYLPFIEEAQPDVAQIGFYGGHFWSLAHTKHYGGYPAHFPVLGIEECGTWFRQRNADLHKRNVRVVGHFNVEFLVGDPDGPDGPRGFFKFYRELWDEERLGPRPVDDPVQLLEVDAAGKPISHQNYSIGGMREYWACLRNPHWQTVLKAWVKDGISQGLDGFIANYFYRHNCLCEHCRREFHEYLSDRFTAAQLREQFDIANLESHVFDELVSWHSPAESTPLRREMLRWSQISNKRVFDEVFINYGRSLKPNLIVAQWNHLGRFDQISSDERCLLPSKIWGQGEDYLWYSTGAAANHTDLTNDFFGDGTLQARYVRGAFDDKPYTLGKYEITRIRSAIAELAANGGAPMGFYTRFTDPAARATIVQYYQFIRQHDALYRGNRPHSEVLLLFPRRQVHRGKVAAVERFRELGESLLNDHVLFDVLPDEMLNDEIRAKYKVVVSIDSPKLGDARLSKFTAPKSVRVSANRPRLSRELDLHFVNYNRDEPPQKNGRPDAGSGIAGEKPIAVSGVQVNLILPDTTRVAGVEVITPESPEPQRLPIVHIDNELSFEIPEFLVYAVARIQLEK